MEQNKKLKLILSVSIILPALILLYIYLQPLVDIFTYSLLGLKADFYKQDFNVGASGGEKKKNELLQMLMLKPQVVILDEVDSGLDTKSKDNLVEILTKFKAKDRTILIITHDLEFYQKLKPDKIYTIQNNQIISI